jgi:hypothetical protein
VFTAVGRQCAVITMTGLVARTADVRNAYKVLF